MYRRKKARHREAEKNGEVKYKHKTRRTIKWPRKKRCPRRTTSSADGRIRLNRGGYTKNLKLVEQRVANSEDPGRKVFRSICGKVNPVQFDRCGVWFWTATHHNLGEHVEDGFTQCVNEVRDRDHDQVYELQAGQLVNTKKRRQKNAQDGHGRRTRGTGGRSTNAPGYKEVMFEISDAIPFKQYLPIRAVQYKNIGGQRTIMTKGCPPANVETPARWGFASPELPERVAAELPRCISRLGDVVDP
ncbi:hypothetical protein C8R45DRAFT_944436 [Mycena sanguinolenta]|nr:hypothetical protein C8R45DRAFT_944436 [Mycena sanguinolenta]